MRVYLTVSSSGDTMNIGTANGLDGATQLVRDLEARFADTGPDDFAALDPADPLNGYEGCDMYCEDGVRRLWWLDGDGTWRSIHNDGTQ